MKVFGALLSPFVRKVVVAAEEKGMAYQLVPSSPGSPDPAFLAASPFGKIPAIDDDGFLLADSSAIIHYMEAKQPSPALIPADPQARGRAIWFDEFADTLYMTSGGKILFHRLVAPRLLKLPCDESIAVQGEAELPRICDYLESAAPAAGWLAGEFSVGDIAVASIIRSLAYVGHGPNAAKYPATAAWYARVTARAAWQKVDAMEGAMAERLGLAEPA